MPDSGTAAAPPATALTELDLALFDALQTSPRAPWPRIGRALGVDGTTAARRWERLRRAGLAWITAHEGVGTATVGYARVRCAPRHAASVSAAVARLPWVFGVDETDGDHDLALALLATDLPALGRAVREEIGGLRGVRAVRTAVGITQYGESSSWRTRAMDSSGRAELPQPRPAGPYSFSARTHDRRPPEEQALLSALAEDGRLPWTELAARTGTGEHTARRRVQRMIRDGDVVLRCDLAHRLAGLPAVLIYRAAVPHAGLARTGNALARLEQVRMCASVSGPDNLLFVPWLHGLDAVGPFDELLAARFPDVEVRERTVVLHSVKRMGRLLDPWGRATGQVPVRAGGGPG
ncbi:AsnC family transcriptional regulator [Streptomyces sp. NPDC090106]|uniref:AsnC family transcriptional regulator n=1 Tax=Streptomyces sp. NPDC090106 TaxID=3365946 RepID=UPI0037FF0F21